MVRTLIALALTAALALLPGCSRKDQPRVVLYTSVDPGVVKPIVDAYTKRTGVQVDLVTDTEATKTTGLVNRLIAEKPQPRADVWWSGETVGTAQLSRAGVLAPYSSFEAENAAHANSLPSWPIRGRKGDWYGLAQRPRVIVYSTMVFTNPDSGPRTLDALATLKKPVAIANPAFSTARGHIAVLFNQMGRDDFVKLFSSIHWRVYDSNSAVVRAVANGECDAGLTDFDDYQGGLKNGWPLGVSFPPLPGADNPRAVVATPGTVALVAGGPHPELAKPLIDELLSISTEQTLAAGDWCSMPVLKGVPVPPGRFDGVTAARVDWERAAEFLDQTAMAWAEAVRGK